RTRVEADEAARHHGEPGLLAHLADHGVAQRFTDLDGSARQPPLPAVGALLEQEPSPPVEDHRRDARPDTDDPGKIRLERDHPPNLLDPSCRRNTAVTPSTRPGTRNPSVRSERRLRRR